MLFIIIFIFITSTLKQKVWKGIATLQRLRGAISPDGTHPVLPDRTAFCPLQDQALQPVLSPLPSTGRGPLQGPLRCPLLDQALCTFS